MTTSKKTFGQRPLVILLILVAASYLNCKTGQKAEHDRGTGLVFATQQDLNGMVFAETPQGAGSELKPTIDLSADMPDIGNQGMQNSCVAWATGYALKGYEERLDSRQNVRFSPAFIYNQLNNGQDGGCKIMDALNLLHEQGVAPWDAMPYSETDYRTMPSADARVKAKPYGIIAWRKVNVRDPKEVKIQLAAGNPVVFAITIDDGFRKADKNSSGEYVWNSKIGNEWGGHAMIVVGYDDSKNAFKVMNSWGPGWGNNGFCWIDYNYFGNNAAEGYIAMDAKKNVTTTDTTSNITTIPVNHTNVPVTTTTINQDTTVTTVVRPNYNPAQFVKAEFYNVQVEHNQVDPSTGANSIKITGLANLPANVGRTFQISMHFYLSNSVQQVRSLQPPKYADVNGFAATGTILYKVPDEGLNNWQFQFYMPYSAFDVQQGYYDASNVYQYHRTYLYGVLTLFIDNFAYAKGEAINFYVDK